MRRRTRRRRGWGTSRSGCRAEPPPPRKRPRVDRGVEQRHLGFRHFVEATSARGPAGRSRDGGHLQEPLAPVRRRPAHAVRRRPAHAVRWPMRRGIARERGREGKGKAETEEGAADLFENVTSCVRLWFGVFLLARGPTEENPSSSINHVWPVQIFKHLFELLFWSSCHLTKFERFKFWKF